MNRLILAVLLIGCKPSLADLCARQCGALADTCPALEIEEGCASTCAASWEPKGDRCFEHVEGLTDCYEGLSECALDACPTFADECPGFKSCEASPAGLAPLIVDFTLDGRAAPPADREAGEMVEATSTAELAGLQDAARASAETTCASVADSAVSLQGARVSIDVAGVDSPQIERLELYLEDMILWVADGTSKATIATWTGDNRGELTPAADAPALLASALASGSARVGLDLVLTDAGANGASFDLGAVVMLRLTAR